MRSYAEPASFNLKSADVPSPGRVLVTGDGQIVDAPLPTSAWNDSLRATGAGGGLSAPVQPPSGTTSSPFVINVTYAASVAAAPVGFTAGVAQAVQFLQSQFRDPVTVNITVGYGEVAGTVLGANALGTSLTYLVRSTYPAISAALASDATTPSDAAAVGSLPAANPVPGEAFWFSTANAKAVGILGPSTAPDGYIGFASLHAFDYDRTDGIALGSYDFFGVAVHEISEVMGRMLLDGGTIGTTANGYYPLDLFHYSAPGVRDFAAGAPGYFSADGGVTDLGGFNAGGSGDAGDWGAAAGDDAFNAFSRAGVVNMAGNADMAVLDTIGWDRVLPEVLGPRVSGISMEPSVVTQAGRAGLLPGATLATVTQTGGAVPAAYTYTLGGPGAAAFSLANAGDAARLSVAGGGLAGAAGGAAYRLEIGVTDTALGGGVSVPLGVIVGGAGGDAIGIAGLLGAADVPAFIYGLDGADALDGTGMTSALWLAGGAGADLLSGGSGADTYLYAATGDSMARAPDIITNFDSASDLIDLTGLGVSLRTMGPIASRKLAAGSIGWQSNGDSTIIYVNAGTRAERLAGTDMRIELQGGVNLTDANFTHA